MERDHGDRWKFRSKSKAKKKVKCWSYGKSGHVRKDYRARKRGGEDKLKSSNF